MIAEEIKIILLTHHFYHIDMLARTKFDCQINVTKRIHGHVGIQIAVLERINNMMMLLSTFTILFYISFVNEVLPVLTVKFLDFIRMYFVR
jgi:hypothetical protein